MANQQQRIEYDSEVRFGVVMYGGVSLAIYINGVANELYELCCSTPKAVDPIQLQAGGGAGAQQRRSTRDVYRKLSWLRCNAGLRADYMAHAANPALPDPFANGDPAGDLDHVRFVVDVVAGTSAGGINGVFLAKALANGEAFASLKQMWINEGDIALLLNDKASYDGIPFAQADRPPQSLLNSDRMYLKLLAAMQSMPVVLPPLPGGESVLSDELDLYVTTTDIRGTVVPLRLFDKVVYEKRHKQVYHFRYGSADSTRHVNDFVPHNNAFLAFASRCTSSFPFAFEPMQVKDAERLHRASMGGGWANFDEWKRFFTGLSDADLQGSGWTERAFGDGGYLDNKPFSYVVEALSWRLASVPIERKLLYVEPAPTHPERDRQTFAEKPDAIENAVDALTHIPQYETIREDLETVLERNRRIERVERIVRKVEADVDLQDEEPFARVLVQQGGQVRKWFEMDLGDMIGYYGSAFLPYWRLRMTTVTDDVADRLADLWNVDRHSDRLYAIRALVRAWREENFYEHKSAATPTQTRSINAFVALFDLKYRARRVSFLLRRTHQLVRLTRRMLQNPGARSPLSESETVLQQRLQQRVPNLAALQPQALLQALTVLRRQLAIAMTGLRRAAWPEDATDSGTPEQRAQLDTLLRMLIGEDLAAPLRQLPGVGGGVVNIDLGAMAVPGGQRTLQEAVYERAKGLFAAARAGGRTQLQDLLEADVVAIGQQSPQGLARMVLGTPRLRAQAAPTAANPQRQKIAVTVDPVSKNVDGAAALNTDEGRVLREFLAEYYLRFDEYDQVSFPLYYGTSTGEPATVEVVRVSPEDATSLIDEQPGRGDTGDKGDEPGPRAQRRKLAGTVLFNFGGFLDERWRRNDIMWGRLDGCERLLATLLPAPEDDALRRLLLEEGQRAILRDEMTQPFYAELLQRFATELKARGQPTLQQDFDALLAALGTDDAQRGTRTALALKAVLGDEGLLDFVKNHYEVRRNLHTETTLKTSARAITITGRILEQIEKKQRQGASRAVWLTRGGRAFQLLLAASTPGALSRRLLLHWLVRLYLFEALVLLGGFAFGAPDVRNFAGAAFGLTLALHVATLLTGDLMQGRWRWARGVTALAAVAVAGLVVIGALRLSQVGLTGVWADSRGGTAATAAAATSRTATSGP